MPEEKEAPPEKPEEKKPEEKEAPKESTELIEKANAAADRLEKANETFEKLIVKQEALQVEKTLSGTAEAGSPTETEDEKADDAARKQLEGTGFEDQLFPKKSEEKK